MEKNIKSLNDLTIAIHEINKKYKISEFVDDFKNAIGKKSTDILNELKNDGVTNPFQKIINASNLISDKQIQTLVKISDQINLKYKYDSYLEECSELREGFLKKRSDYFSARATTSVKAKDTVSSLFELSGSADIILSDWIDKMLNKIRPNTLDIVYENLNGKKTKTKIGHHSVSITKNYIDAPLIDRYHGINAYDSFLLRSFYDMNKNNWVYVPIRLIISLECSADIQDL